MISDEEKVKILFSKIGLESLSFDKKEINVAQTPDFKVFKNDQLLFFCEVKSIAQDDWLDKQLESAPPLTIVGGFRNDPVFNRLSNKIHEAVSQFDSVNPSLNYPNVLVFLNHNDEDSCGYIDLLGVITGFAQIEKGHRLNIYTKYSEGRIKYEKARANLYIWITEKGETYYLFNKDNKHYSDLCAYFGKDPDAMKKIVA
jgi:hypothetical protein